MLRTDRTLRATRTMRRTAAVAVVLVWAAAMPGGCAPSHEAGLSGAGAGENANVAGPEILPVEAKEIPELVRDGDATLVLVNVWATWCQPCKEEFPDLVRIHRDFAAKGVRVMFISADFEGQIPDARAFLDAQGVDFVTYRKTGNDEKFIDALSPDWSGALPGTFLFREGELLHGWEGKQTYEEFERRILEALKG